MSALVPILDRLHARARANGLLYRIVLGTRVLFAAGFIPTGLVKLLGERFTAMPVTSPVGAFFEAMYQTGGYWRFLGGVQLLAGILFLVPRAATLAVLLFYPVIVNIFVITVALGFRGTPYVTGAMLFGATALLAWEWDRLRWVFTRRPVDPATLAVPPVERLGPWWEKAAYAIGTASCLAFFFSSRGMATPRLALAAIAVGTAAALTAAGGLWLAFRRG